MSSGQDETTRVTKVARERKKRVKEHGVRTPGYLWKTLTAANEHVGWQQNALLHRIILRKVDNGWQALVKATRGKHRGIAYVNGRSLADCLELLSLRLDDGSLEWKPDDY